MMKLLTDLEVRGRKFEVNVDDTGVFWTKYDGEQLRAVSLDELREKLNRATKSLKLSIRFAMRKDDAVLIGVCTGKHATNRNYLVRWETQRGGPLPVNEQLSGWYLEKCVDPEYSAEYSRLCMDVDAAVKIREEFERKHRVNVRAVADAEIENAMRAEKKGGA